MCAATILITGYITVEGRNSSAKLLGKETKLAIFSAVMVDSAGHINQAAMKGFTAQNISTNVVGLNE
ncbi:hypothetical protein F6P93_23420 (plasmid) [Escherichia coli]|nr:hypothetical protein F6P93_23420 [Escherichia coli]